MPKPASVLLVVDAFINFLLGLLLLGFSRPIAHLLGVPYTDVKFYPTILGAVLFGIGIALMIEAFRNRKALRVWASVAPSLSICPVAPSCGSGSSAAH
jgi:uncharacterized membrane protein HdeD (DUF308 family)